MTKYETHVRNRLSEIEAWAKAGVSDKQIAKNLGIAYSTFRQYVKKYSQLDSVLTKGKQEVDEKVENALLKRALGYTYDEVKETYDGDQLTKRQVVTKHVPADVGAMIFWLKNRRPQDWKSDYHKVKHDEKVLDLREKELEAKAW
ncbi:helix-turn-helix transcriptional regulator [Turicibacter sanguinis]|uniref:helix-turn-helix transcriptional regulator n=1 Tax=Turicibacter sanguinis TaxID=154288 RepID=UPI00232DA2A9|nr:helix-turn-helix domain-containing protein [Turicibacter sanguinis]MDB8575367.1 helix-turn-helix domain-containing protein [Turicibacter sanguinis]MDB8577306.1 helix-turn-helix domain-containing protein [Turicibacter sanguinis]MDB8584395.1 helix-turn-helix domain-containing protein [Turicibacter sanguinis]MDB8586842.1 helix-turn-helix domain-containing protein [Turicibacter sanguinis]MDB8597562.1 helix-turn-helix domain-containing protein [Turicibacter sanguinis]